MTMPDAAPPYVSRSGYKLEAALRALGLEVREKVCADIGSHVGGFVDCLLRHGAARVHAIDPGYGVLHARLRRDPRVIVHERTNALRFVFPEPCELITIDAGWTPQRLILAAARRGLSPGGHVLTLVKPQYEAPPRLLRRGVLPPEHRGEVLRLCETDVLEAGWLVLQRFESPLPGHAGNIEYFWHLARTG